MFSIFITYSTLYCHSNLWIHEMYINMYECVYALCTYVRMYVHAYIHDNIKWNKS
jgi:hypothetical protein